MFSIFIFYLASLFEFSQEIIPEHLHSFEYKSNDESMKSAKNYPIPDDFDISVPHFLEKYGYPFELYNVTTEDGYILSLHRIPHGKDYKVNSNVTSKPSILLMHGLFCSSMDWIYMGPMKSLGLVLADAGYDVWLGNNRGNTWSRNHTNLDPDKDPSFWDFSFHEFGYYDVPAFIDFILEETKNEKLYYIGHSQGTTQFFAMLSTRTEYRNKIAHMIALAPIAYLSHQKSIIPAILTKYQNLLSLFLDSLQIHELFRHTPMLTQMGIILCNNGSPAQSICSSIISILCGEDEVQLNMTQLPVILSSTPAGTSVKTIEHLGQLISSGNFQQYDYGILGNVKKYHSSSPPLYNLSAVQVPVSIYTSQNDLFNSKEDVSRVVQELPRVVKYYTLPYKKFSHLDYLTAIDVDTLMNKELIQYLNNIVNNKIPVNPPEYNQAASIYFKQWSYILACIPIFYL